MKKILPKIIGNRYEAMAETYLHRQGLVTLARNYYCRFGEIDLIMTQNELLVFVEVRARKTDAFGSAIETVGVGKQQKIIKTAQYFLQQSASVAYNAIRFDIIGISSANHDINWVQNAFMVHNDTWT